MFRSNPLGDVPGLVDLAALDGGVRTEDASDRLARRVRPVHDEEEAALRIEATFDDERPDRMAPEPTARGEQRHPKPEFLHSSENSPICA